MRVLFVEDDADQMAAVVAAVGARAEFSLARSRDSALELLESGDYDLAVCDLKIPPEDEGSGEDIEHGFAVMQAVKKKCPGTPIIAFTAHNTQDFLTRIQREHRHEDFLGKFEDLPMLVVMDKTQLFEFVQHVVALADEFDIINGIELVYPLNDPMTDRLLRLCTRQRGGVLAHITELAGGLSGARTVRVAVQREDGTTGGSLVARIADVATLEAERKTVAQRVSGILPMGSYPEVVGFVKAGAGRLGAVLYQVAVDAVSIFTLATTDDQAAASAVRRLQACEEPWRQNGPFVSVPLGEVRRVLIPDELWDSAAARCGFDDATRLSLEEIIVNVQRCTIHADLHGGNVLVAGDPVIIDFTYVTDGPTPIDPVTLELSLLFHPSAPQLGAWPSNAQLEQWMQLDAYLVDCPVPEFVRACREWANEVARGGRDVPASAYSYVASQSRFADSPPERLSALMRGLIPRLK